MLDKEYIEELRTTSDNKENKNLLAEYAKTTYDINLRRNKSFENMVSDLEQALNERSNEPLPEQTDNSISTRDLIDQFESQDESTPEDEKIQLLVEDKTEDVAISEPTDANQAKESAKLVEDIAEVNDKAESIPEEPKQVGEYELPEDFVPKFNLLGGNGFAYYSLQHWIYSWIEANDDWKNRIEEFPYKNEINTLQTLLYYIKKDGSITVRETKNSNYIRLE